MVFENVGESLISSLGYADNIVGFDRGSKIIIAPFHHNFTYYYIFLCNILQLNSDTKKPAAYAAGSLLVI
ncbi:hypothetical protein ACQKND_06855 [Viridibacillus arvi]|uniref:hypothetical protein n=1 Tax=Viridibacillus arvi TaxID=263475 RepID=UPI003CFC935E